MQRVGFDDHRAPGGQSRSRICPRSTEGQREVRRSEHGDGADRQAHAPQIGPWASGLFCRAAGVDGHVEERALLEDVGEETELPGGTGQLAGEPRRPEGRLLIGELGQRRGGTDGGGHVPQGPHPFGQGHVLEGLRGGGGGGQDGGELVR